MTKSTSSPATHNPGQGPLYGVLSVALFAHLFCILVAFSGNGPRSLLQVRLLAALRPYVQLLNFDPNLTPYQLTHATIDDVDHRLEILPAGADAADDSAWIVLPGEGFRSLDAYKRQQRFAKAMAVLTEQENDELVAEFARSAGSFALQQLDVTPQQIRVRRHLLQSWDASAGRGPGPRNPHAAAYFETAYAANVLSDEAGNVDVIKISGRRETALPTSEGAAESP